MFKRTHLRAVNPEQPRVKNESTGMSVKQIMIIAGLTAIGSQLALEGYKAIKISCPDCIISDTALRRAHRWAHQRDFFHSFFKPFKGA